MHEGKPIAGLIITASHGMLQSHLGGTVTAALNLAPMKLLLDEIRLWGIAQGMHVFHLGGGATSSPDDSILHFKAGFSDRRHQFGTWRWVVFPDEYTRLREDFARRHARNGIPAASLSFFPEYRSDSPSVEAPRG
jgi:hypothetical protein